MTDPKIDPTERELVNEFHRVGESWQRVNRAQLRRRVLEEPDETAAEPRPGPSQRIRVAIPVAGVIVLVVAIGLALSERTRETPSAGVPPAGTAPVGSLDPADTSPASTISPAGTAPVGSLDPADTSPASTISSGGTAPSGTIPATRSELVAKLAEELDGRYNGIYETADAVVVQLRSGDSEVAADLVNRYGSELRIVVGALPYPPTESDHMCPTLESVGPLSDIGIEVETSLPTLQATESDKIAFVATMNNHTNSPVAFSAAEANITTEGGRVLTVVTWGGDAMEDRFEVPQGGSARIPADLPVASCDPRIGYRIEPGQHWVVLRLLVVDDFGVARGWRDSEPVPVTITFDD